MDFNPTGKESIPEMLEMLMSAAGGNPKEALRILETQNGGLGFTLFTMVTAILICDPLSYLSRVLPSKDPDGYINRCAQLSDFLCALYFEASRAKTFKFHALANLPGTEPAQYYYRGWLKRNQLESVA